MAVTSPRGRAKTAPGNVTGRRFAEQQAHAQEAKKNPPKYTMDDLMAVRETAWAEGADAGVDAGVMSVLDIYTAEGAAGLDRLVAEVAELDTDEHQAGEDD